MFNKIQTKFKKNKAYNPFCSDFKKDKIDKLIGELSKNLENGDITIEEANKLKDLALLSIIMHPFFLATYKSIYLKLSTSNLDVSTIAKLLLAIVNREHLLIASKRKKKLEKTTQEHYNFADFAAYNIESTDKRIGKVDAQGALECSIDTINLLLNYLRYHLTSHFKNTETKVPDCIETINHLFKAANELFIAKYDYEDTLWNGGYVQIDKKNKNITFKYDSHEQLKLLRVGSIILNQRKFGLACQYQVTNKESTISKYYKPKRATKMFVEDGVLKFKIGSGKNKILEDYSIGFQAAIDSHYEFLKNVQLPNLNNITIEKALSIWVIICSLMQYVKNNLLTKDDSIYAEQDVNKFPHIIKKNNLIWYIELLSKLKRSEISRVIKLFEADWQRANDIWDTPFFPIKDDYIFAIMPIADSMIYNTIDLIIDKGGIDLSDRGGHFENYLRNTLNSKSNQWGYSVNIIECKQFENKNNEEEEIDLIVSLAEIIIICEVKCIQYPMTVRDHHNCWKKLQQGCKQAERKAEFIKRNAKIFKNKIENLDSKIIIPIVVTNYPLYTGFQHNEVYVTDSYSFLSYFSTGSISVRSAGINVNTMIHREQVYSSEKEFSTHFSEFVKNNPILKFYKSKISIEEMIHPTLENGFSLNLESAKVNHSELFDVSNNE